MNLMQSLSFSFPSESPVRLRPVSCQVLKISLTCLVVRLFGLVLITSRGTQFSRVLCTVVCTPRPSLLPTHFRLFVSVSATSRPTQLSKNSPRLSNERDGGINRAARARRPFSRERGQTKAAARRQGIKGKTSEGKA